MADQVAAWDDLEESIDPTTDQTLWNEVRLSALAGATRLAYIGLWLAAAEALHLKLKDMARRDGAVGKSIKAIEQKQSSDKSTDQSILDAARTHGLVSPVEHLRLSQIKDMRHKYAHPTGEAAGPQAVLGAAETVVDCILNRPPRLGRAFATTIADKLWDDPTWVNPTRPALQRRARDIYDRLQPDAVTALVDENVARIQETLHDPDSRDAIRRAIVFTQVIVKLGLAAGNVTIEDLQQFRDNHDDGASIVLSDPNVFGQLKADLKHQVVANLLARAASEPTWALRALRYLHDADMLSKKQDIKLKELLHTTVTVEAVDLAGFDEDLTTDVAIRQLLDGDFNVVNPAARFIRNEGPELVSDFTSGLQRELGEAAAAGAHLNAYGSLDLIRAVANAKRRWPDDFRAGMAAGILRYGDPPAPRSRRTDDDLLPAAADIIANADDTDRVLEYVTQQLDAVLAEDHLGRFQHVLTDHLEAMTGRTPVVRPLLEHVTNFGAVGGGRAS